MDILGLIAANTNLLLAIAGTLTMLLLGVYVPAAIKRRHDASAEFRSAFDGVLLNLRENPDCPIAQIAFGFHQEHLAAITKFRAHVSIWRRRGFDKAVAHYKDAYDVARDFGNVFAVAYSEKTEVAKARRKHYSEAINRLLSYA
jgi:hypothetical protein